MRARMNNPALVLPEALKALQALNKATEIDSLPEVTRMLIHLRASQINGCSVCVHMHSLELRKAGQKDERIFAVAAWRDTPWFSEAERAALALTEAVTRVSDKADPVPDDVWTDAARHYDEKTLSALILSIGLINVWNRLNAAVRQVAGAAWN
ncbi:carboxymuconolactone decarboxylase family protein [Aminobacter niigataensis]|nr:carboxymuconolactone decarboxylase family protein [Aminobacter niigataensis]CAI2932183.1 Alkylhydroperoxidase AhpD family core domain protein [Aminobacter niigataensis]